MSMLASSINPLKWQHRWTSGQHETELGQQAADPFDASCALMLETFAQPVYAPVSDL